MAANQAEHHEPDEPKTQALVLSGQGYSNGRISSVTGIPERTVRRWVKRGREVAVNEENPLIQEDWVRIVRRSQGHMHTYLDYLDDNPDKVVGQAMVLNVYAGTGTDKLQKKDNAGGARVNVQFNFYTDG